MRFAKQLCSSLWIKVLNTSRFVVYYMENNVQCMMTSFYISILMDPVTATVTVLVWFRPRTFAASSSCHAVPSSIYENMLLCFLAVLLLLQVDGAVFWLIKKLKIQTHFHRLPNTGGQKSQLKHKYILYTWLHYVHLILLPSHKHINIFTHTHTISETFHQHTPLPPLQFPAYCGCKLLINY